MKAVLLAWVCLKRLAALARFVPRAAPCALVVARKRLEQLDEVAGRILEQGVSDDAAGDDSGPETGAGVAQRRDSRREIRDLQRDAIPAAGLGHRTIGQDVAPTRHAQQESQVAPVE